MSKMIQIRNVPDELHRLLKARAASSGMSLSGYLLQELERLGALPTRAEWLERLRQREPVDIDSEEIVATIREARDADDPRDVNRRV